MLFERLVAATLGAASGAVLYGTWELLSRYLLPGHLFFAVPLKWYIIGGALFGLLGGFQAARSLWEYALDQLELEATTTVWFSAVVVVIAVAVAAALWASRSA